MSEVTTRAGATRGRGSARGGRGGSHMNRGGGRQAARPNGDKNDGADQSPAIEDDAAVVELRKTHGANVGPIKEMFPDWSEADILYALNESEGDLSQTVERIADGTVFKWSEVAKPKKAARAKDKDAATTSTAEAGTGHSKPARGGRQVSEGGRGRGRVTERGGRAPPRGRSAAATNGARAKENSTPMATTEDSNAWATSTKSTGAWADGDGWSAKDTPAEKAPVQETAKPVVPQGKTWASMLRQSTTPKPAPKPKEAPAKKAPELQTPVAQPEAVEEEELEGAPDPEPEDPIEEEQAAAEQAAPAIVEPEVALPPSRDQLTEMNLEQVTDDSKPAMTETAASTAADSWDPRTTAQSNPTGTPISASQQQHQAPRLATAGIPTPASGFAATALKATAGRSQSYQRRILDQEEAVRMPGNREVEKAAVQFGAFNLGESEEDVDGDREEAETRAQPPVASPVTHPRASLPPVAQPTAVPDAFPPQKAPTPAAPAGAPTGPAAQQTQVQAPSSTAPVQPASQQFGRFGQATAQDSSFGSYTQPGTSVGGVGSNQQPYDNFSSQQTQAPTQSSAAAYTSAQSDYNSFYTADAQNRGAPYTYYGQQFGQNQQQQQQQQQQAGSQGQDSAAASSQQQQQSGQQRQFGYNNTGGADLSQYPQSASMHSQTRFGVSADSQNSGHTTPNPPGQGQQPGAQGAQAQSHGQPQAGYQYNNSAYPYYPYYQQYYNAQQYGAGPYGAGPYGGGKGMHSSYMPPFDHTSTQASGFGNHGSLHRDNSAGLGSGIGGDYSRGTQSQAPGLGGNSFGSAAGSTSGMDAFRSAAGFGQTGSGAASSAADDLKQPYGDAKGAGGPSPAALGGGARPGSAANNAPSAQTGLPPQAGGYGGYPASHLQHGGLQGNSGYGMSGGSGGQHASSPYGSYNQQSNFGGGGSYYSNQQQRQGGWSGNYNQNH